MKTKKVFTKNGFYYDSRLEAVKREMMQLQSKAKALSAQVVDVFTIDNSLSNHYVFKHDKIYAIRLSAVSRGRYTVEVFDSILEYNERYSDVKSEFSTSAFAETYLALLILYKTAQMPHALLDNAKSAFAVYNLISIIDEDITIKDWSEIDLSEQVDDEEPNE